MVMKQRLARIFSIGRPIPDYADRVAEFCTLRRRILNAPFRIDDIKRLNALDNLAGDWSCKPLRALLCKLGKDGD